MKQLRFTTSNPFIMGITDNNTLKHKIPQGVKINMCDELKASTAYIHGDAEDLAGYDIPVIFDGDMAQLDRPQHEQDIVMCLWEEEHPVHAVLVEPEYSNPRYHFILK